MCYIEFTEYTKGAKRVKLSTNGKKLIQSFEGLRLEAYKAVQTEKYYTIGYGHYGADVSRGSKITKEEADELFNQDVKRFVDGVDKRLKVKVNQNQFDALVSFAYNVGLGNFQSSTLLKKVNLKDFDGASMEFARWNKSGGKVLKGLITRRNKEKALFIKPVKKTTTKTYTVKKGDTLSEIAVKYKTTVSVLLKKNPSIKDPDLIKIGQKIKY